MAHPPPHSAHRPCFQSLILVPASQESAAYPIFPSLPPPQSLKSWVTGLNVCNRHLQIPLSLDASTQILFLLVFGLGGGLFFFFFLPHHAACGIFPSQGLKLGLLHCRQILYLLSHQGRLNLRLGFEKSSPCHPAFWSS